MMSPKDKTKPPPEADTEPLGTPRTNRKRNPLLKSLKGKLNKPSTALSDDGDIPSPTPKSSAPPKTTRASPDGKPLWANAMSKQASKANRMSRRASLDQTFAEFSQSAHNTRARQGPDNRNLSKSMHLGIYTEQDVSSVPAGSPPSGRGRSGFESRNQSSKSMHGGTSSSSVSALDRRKQRHELSKSVHDEFLQSPRSKNDAASLGTKDSPGGNVSPITSAINVLTSAPSPPATSIQNLQNRSKSPKMNPGGQKRAKSVSGLRRSRPGMKRDNNHQYVPPNQQFDQRITRREDNNRAMMMRRGDSHHRDMHLQRNFRPEPPGGEQRRNPQQLRNKPRRNKEGPPPTQLNAIARRQSVGQNRIPSRSNSARTRRKKSVDRMHAVRNGSSPDLRLRSLSTPRKQKFGRSPSLR
jgi:hypothetical protein